MSDDSSHKTQQRSDQRTPTFGASSWIQRRRALLQEREQIVPLRGPDPVRKRATTPSGSKKGYSSPRRTSFGNSEYTSKRHSLRKSEVVTTTTPSRLIESDLRQKHYWKENLRGSQTTPQPDVEWCGSTSLPTLNKRCAAFSPPPPIRILRSPAKNSSTPPREGQETPSVRIMSLRSIDKHRHQMIAEKIEQTKSKAPQNDEEMGWKPILAGPRAMPSPPPSPKVRMHTPATAPATRASPVALTPPAIAPPPIVTPKTVRSPSVVAAVDLRKEVERLRMENAMLRAEKINLQDEKDERDSTRDPQPQQITEYEPEEGESQESPKMSEPKPHSPGRRFQPIAEAAELDNSELPDIPPDDEKGAAVSETSSISEKEEPQSSQPQLSQNEIQEQRKQSSAHISFDFGRRATNPRQMDTFRFGDSDEESNDEENNHSVNNSAQVAIQSHFVEAAQRRSSMRDPTSPATTRRASIVMPNEPTPPEEALVSVDDIQDGIEYSEMLLKRSTSVSTVTRKPGSRKTSIAGALAVLSESTFDDDDGVQSSRSSSHSDGNGFLISTSKHLQITDLMSGDDDDCNVLSPTISEIEKIEPLTPQPPPQSPRQPPKSKYISETETETDSSVAESSTLSSETSSD